jgi:hypothetical protein
MVLREEPSLHSKIPDLKVYLRRPYFDGATVSGVDASFDARSLRYDSKWLSDASGYLREKWCTLHCGLASATAGCNRYNVATWLSTMLYALSADIGIIQALAAFYRSRDFGSIQFPAPSKFNLDRGDTWKETDIRNDLINNAKSYDLSAEVRLPKQGPETNSYHANRIHSLFQHRKTQATN